MSRQLQILVALLANHISIRHCDVFSYMKRSVPSPVMSLATCYMLYATCYMKRSVPSPLMSLATCYMLHEEVSTFSSDVFGYMLHAT